MFTNGHMSSRSGRFRYHWCSFHSEKDEFYQRKYLGDFTFLPWCYLIHLFSMNVLSVCCDNVIMGCLDLQVRDYSYVPYVLPTSDTYTYMYTLTKETAFSHVLLAIRCLTKVPGSNPCWGNKRNLASNLPFIHCAVLIQRKHFDINSIFKR